MQKIKQSIKEILKELAALFVVLILLLALIIPVWTIWDGPLSKTVALEYYASELKSNSVRLASLNNKDFSWDIVIPSISNDNETDVEEEKQ